MLKFTIDDVRKRIIIYTEDPTNVTANEIISLHKNNKDLPNYQIKIVQEKAS